MKLFALTRPMQDKVDAQDTCEGQDKEARFQMKKWKLENDPSDCPRMRGKEVD
jgi:hypothetical protein